MQRLPRFVQNRFAAVLNDELAIGTHSADFVHRQIAKCRARFRDVGAANLYNCAEFFVEKRTQCVATQRINRDGKSRARSDHHLRQRRKQSAVRFIVIREEQACFVQRLHAREKRFEIVRRIAIGHVAAHGRMDLREDRPAQALTAASSVDKQQNILAFGAQQRRQRCLHVRHIRERGDD